MTHNNDISVLLAELVDLSESARNDRLIELQKSNPDVYQEITSLLPFTEGDSEGLEIDPFINAQIDSFTIIRRIGSGGMGRVYKAQQDEPERDVALKILRRGLITSSASKRFEIECQLLGRMKHCGIAQIYDAGTHSIHGDKIPWIAMEFIPEATPLTAYANNHNLSTNERLLLFKQVCEAVSEAHRHGVIHRDLKPANIIVDCKGNPKIIDFGVAKALDPMGLSTVLRTHSLDFVGTMQYMSPEQARGEHVDVSTDIYSLGVILFELVSGERPYTLGSTSIPIAIQAISNAEPKPLSEINDTLGGDLETVVLKAMACNPRHRYRTAIEFCDDVIHVVNGEPIVARKESRLIRFLSKRKRTAAGLMIALPILAVSTGTSLYFSAQAQTELAQKEKLIEFAKKALATRDEIIMTNPEYWNTHYSFMIDEAREIAGENESLLASMLSLFFSDTDSTVVRNNLRLQSAKLLQSNEELATLLKIDYEVFNSLESREERLENVERLISAVPSSSNMFQLRALIAKSHLKLHIHDQSVQREGIEDSLLAEQIIIDEYNGEFTLLYPLLKRRAWSYLFHSTDPEASQLALNIVDNHLIEMCRANFGLHHSNTLTTMNLRGIALQQLSRYKESIDVLQEASRIAVESYGVSHNITWRYLNNLAISKVLLAHESTTSVEDESELITDAILLWNECIKQAVTHNEPSGLGWYLPVFQEMLPEYAPKNAEVSSWKSEMEAGPAIKNQEKSFRSVLAAPHIPQGMEWHGFPVLP